MWHEPLIFLFYIYIYFCVLFEVCYFVVRMDAVKSDLDGIRWIVAVGFKVQRAFWNSRLCFPCLSVADRDEMRFEKDAVKDDGPRVCFSKHFLLCAARALGWLLLRPRLTPTRARFSDDYAHTWCCWSRVLKEKPSLTAAEMMQALCLEQHLKNKWIYVWR